MGRNGIRIRGVLLQDQQHKISSTFFLPPLPPSLYIPPPVDHRDDIPEYEQPPRKSTIDAEARRQGISEFGYGIRDTWVGPAEALLEIAPVERSILGS
ncbi:hypothetical protein Tco_0039580 [Tanacetum coccineum]